MNVLPDGPIPARIMLVGEAPGADEEREGTPFVGVSGQELNRMLQEAGIMRSECFTTNVCRVRPPNNDIGAFVALKKKDVTSAHLPLRDKMVMPCVMEGYRMLLSEIDIVKPNVIITLGNLSMWALTGAWGITKWRGSLLRLDGKEGGPKVIPTYHPAAVLRQWDWRAIAVNDLRRAKEHSLSRDWSAPQWSFIIRPSFSQAITTLNELYSHLEVSELWIDFDIETRAGHIACAGISWSLTDAICLPFMCVENKEGYWSLEEEAAVVHSLFRVLTHRNVKVRWQNGLYDAQYTFRHWHFVPRGAQDTMIAQHSMFAALPKSLAFIASMYCKHYVYWKDDGKTWNKNTGEEQLWSYNLVDCVRTRESGEVEAKNIVSMGLQEVDSIQQRLFWPVLQAMQLGVRLIPEARNKLSMEIQEELSAREAFLQTILGHNVNVNSSLQMQKLFYEDLGMKPVLKRTLIAGKTVFRPTVDDDALQKIGNREPLLKPVTNAIADIRTLAKWLNDFVLMKLDTDGRMRCSFNIAGDAKAKSAPYSFRLSSSENAFDSGGNLQTIPSEKSKSVGKATARGSMAFDLPNIRSMYGPDKGFTFFDMDLDRADLHVFVWEIDDELYKQMLKLKVDAHLFHVYLLDDKEPPPLDELVEGHPKYPDHRGPRKHKREFSKVFCHAVDYVGSPRTIAEHTNRTVHEVDKARKKYLGVHPKIEPYWKEVEAQIRKRRYVENKFGYRWHIFDRIDGALPEAVAWVPQSTVGCTINRTWLNIYDHAKEIQVLLQVHDSLAGQFPSHLKEQSIRKLKEEARIIIPYSDPLIIPVGVEVSDQSWGECSA